MNFIKSNQAALTGSEAIGIIAYMIGIRLNTITKTIDRAKVPWLLESYSLW